MDAALQYCAYATWWERFDKVEAPAWSGESFRDVEERMRKLGARILKRPGMKDKTIAHIELLIKHKL